LILFAAFALGAGTLAWGQEQNLANWVGIESGFGGIILVAEGDVTGTVFVLKSDGKILDETKWISKFPFVKQYRLPPGTYEIVGTPQKIDVVGGQQLFVRYTVKGVENPIAYFKLASGPFKPKDIIEKGLSNPYFGVEDVKVPVEAFSSIQYVEPVGTRLELVPERRPPPPPN